MPRAATPKTKEEPPEEPVVDTDAVDAAHADVDALNDQTPPETIDQAAARIYGEDAVVRPIIAKLARIMGDLPELKPEGTNTFHKYQFIKDTQVSGALRPRLAREGVMIIPDVVEESWVETKTKAGATSWVTKMKIHFTAIDAASGDQISGHGFGYGDDSGDKGANKAFTAALKYWLMKLFQIGGEDNEDDEKADKRAAERGGAQPSVTSVTVEGAKIEGVQRGGMSEKMTMTQKKQIFALYKDLELTPEGFADRIEKHLGDKLVLPEDGDATAALNAYVNRMTADDAGTLLTGLVDEKDAKEVGPPAAEQPVPPPADDVAIGAETYG